MKKSLRNNQEVAHVWASQDQTEGHASNFFFEGPSIFSYGHHFEVARIVRPGLVLFNESSYSVSTSKHQRYARSAVSRMRVFNIPGLKWQADVNHNESAEFYIQTLNDRLFYISRMRSDSTWQLQDYARLAGEAAAYVLEFGKHIRKPLQRAIADVYEKRENPLTPEQLEKMKARAAANRERAKAERIAREKEEAERREEVKKYYDAWKRGEDIGARVDFSRMFPVALRVVGDEIQTSQGASVPIIEARKLWRVLRSDATQAVGMRIGHYVVTRLDPEKKALIIGCHTIPMGEIARMAVTLGLESEAA